MGQGYVRLTALVAGLLLLTVGAFATGTQEMEEVAEDADGGSVSVIATWGGSERDVFNDMIAPFEDE
ncbi:MAG: hypothetical protein ACOCY8_06940, partial [Spirochaetota bacterium]